MNKVLVVDIAEVLERYKGKEDEFKKNILVDHLTSLNQSEKWPDEGAPLKQVVESVREGSFGEMSLVGGLLIIGSKDNLLNHYWEDLGVRRTLHHYLSDEDVTEQGVVYMFRSPPTLHAPVGLLNA